jgi:hypothetical protein
MRLRSAPWVFPEGGIANSGPASEIRMGQWCYVVIPLGARRKAAAESDLPACFLIVPMTIS